MKFKKKKTDAIDLTIFRQFFFGQTINCFLLRNIKENFLFAISFAWPVLVFLPVFICFLLFFQSLTKCFKNWNVYFLAHLVRHRNRLFAWLSVFDLNLHVFCLFCVVVIFRISVFFSLRRMIQIAFESFIYRSWKCRKIKRPFHIFHIDSCVCVCVCCVCFVNLPFNNSILCVLIWFWNWHPFVINFWAYPDFYDVI